MPRRSDASSVASRHGQPANHRVYIVGLFCVTFAVRDTGPGMTPREIETALEPFGQVDAGRPRRYEVTGLGLPLAQRLVELHAGLLTIDSVKALARR